MLIAACRQTLDVERVLAAQIAARSSTSRVIGGYPTVPRRLGCYRASASRRTAEEPKRFHDYRTATHRLDTAGRRTGAQVWNRRNGTGMLTALIARPPASVPSHFAAMTQTSRFLV